MTSQPQGEKPSISGDKEIWRATKGDYYAPSIHVTTTGAIGINVGGTVVVLPVEKWHTLAKDRLTTPATQCADEGINLTQTFDARVWAKEWLRIITLNPEIPTDEGTMISWFANALMAGYDEASRRRESADEEIATPRCDALGFDEWILPDNRLVVSIRWKDLARQLERENAALVKEREETIKQLAEMRGILSREVLTEDSYGVHGSEFYTCPFCHEESGAGVLNKGITHASNCILNGDANICESVTKLAEERDSLCDFARTLERERNQLDELQGKFYAEIITLKAELASLQSTMDAERAELRRAVDQHDYWQELAGSFESQVNSLRAALAERDRGVIGAQLFTQLVDLRSQLQERDRELRELHTKDRVRTTEYNILTQENRDLRSQLQAVMATLENTRSAHLQAEQEAADLEGEVRELESQLQAATARAEEAEKRICCNKRPAKCDTRKD